MKDVLYHTGFLAKDREENEALDERASKYARLAAEGKAVLYQHRIAEDCYRYYARIIKGAL